MAKPTDEHIPRGFDGIPRGKSTYPYLDPDRSSIALALEAAGLPIDKQCLAPSTTQQPINPKVNWPFIHPSTTTATVELWPWFIYLIWKNYTLLPNTFLFTLFPITYVIIIEIIKNIDKYLKDSIPLITHSLQTYHVKRVKTALTIKYTLFINIHFVLLFSE